MQSLRVASGIHQRRSIITGYHQVAHYPEKLPDLTTYLFWEGKNTIGNKFGSHGDLLPNYRARDKQMGVYAPPPQPESSDALHTASPSKAEALCNPHAVVLQRELRAHLGDLLVGADNPSKNEMGHDLHTRQPSVMRCTSFCLNHCDSQSDLALFQIDDIVTSSLLATCEGGAPLVDSVENSSGLEKRDLLRARAWYHFLAHLPRRRETRPKNRDTYQAISSVAKRTHRDIAFAPVCGTTH